MGFVYLIGSEKFGWYKMGKAKSHDVRIDQLGILLPFKVEVFAIWESLDHSNLERQAHRIHDKNRINGEWFSFSLKERSDVIRRLSSWDSTLIFPTDGSSSKPIRSSNVEKDSIQPSVKKQMKQAYVDKFLKERGLAETMENIKLAFAERFKVTPKV